MPRPIKWRCVTRVPSVTYFKPAGQPLRALAEVALTVEEVEAIRLKDLEGMEQQEGAERMRISRPTFHRVLQSARRKLADVLVNGKALRIEGGNFAFPTQAFQCPRDGHVWTVPFEALAAGPPPACPRCQSPAALAVHRRGHGAGRGWGRWRNQPRGERQSRRYKGGEP
jgi:predicted DNA-binding protein (UPF0251 family)